VAAQTVPALYVPRPAETQPWVGTPVAALTLQQLDHKTTSKPKLWRWDHVPMPDWQMPSFWMDSAIIEILNHKTTSKTKQWHWEPDPPPPWVVTPEMMNADALYIPVTQIKAARSPVFAPKGDQEVRTWQWEPPYNVTLNFKPVAVPFYKSWRWDHVPDPTWQMPSDWMTANIIYQLDYLPTSPTKQWRYDYDADVRLWLGEPAPTNITTIPFNEPFNKLWRWDADFDIRLWQGQPLSAYALEQVEYVPTSPTKQWRWDNVPAPDWIGQPLSAYSLIQTDYKPTSPAKFWRWDHDSDVRLWLGQPVPTNIEIIPIQIVSTLQTIPPFVVPRPAEQQSWQWQPPFNEQLAQPKPLNPFYRQWRYDVVPDPFWLGQPVASLAAYLPATQLYAVSPVWAPDPDSSTPWIWTPPIASPLTQVHYTPVSPTKQWRWDNVPQPDWNMPPFWMDSAILGILDYKPTSKQKLWRYDWDSDVRLWQGQPVISNINNIPPPVAQGAARSPVFAPRGDPEVKLWLGTPQEAYGLYIPIKHNPVFKLWRYDLNTDTALWLGAPQAAYPLQQVDYTPTSPAKLWRWDYVPQPDWLGTPQAAYILNQLNHRPTSPTKLWRWDYDADVRIWLAGPVGTNIEFLIPAPVQAPFYKVWRWDHVPVPDWVGQPLSSNILRQLTHLKPKNKQLWRYDHDSDTRLWQGQPVGVFAKNFPPPPPFKYAQAQWQWAYDYQPAPPWVWVPLYPPVIIPPLPPPPPPVPRRRSNKNLFPPNLTYTVANPNTTLPTPARTSPLVKVYVNEPATVYLGIFDIAPVEYQVTAPAVQLQFIRPDGTFYYVVGSPYTYISMVNGYPYITYTSAVGEFNQVGWWTAVFTIGTAQSQQFAFYIHAPGQ
jgi:hypothetical protein